MVWYYYLQDTLNFPFDARIIDDKAIPLADQRVQVISLADEEDCEAGILVIVKQGAEEPLFMQLEHISIEGLNKETAVPMGDWHYWVERGYSF